MRRRNRQQSDDERPTFSVLPLLQNYSAYTNIEETV